MITNRGERYPRVYPETWRTRGWLLIRKIQRRGLATANDRRVAMLLLGHSEHARAHAELRGRLEEIAYGSTQDSTTPDAVKAAGLGADEWHPQSTGER